LPDLNLPRLWCDFNAWEENETGQRCFFSLHRVDLLTLPPEEGLRIFIWEDDSFEGVGEIIGCEATLEHALHHNGGWRAVSDESAWYRGKAWWE
jgi:hypothetical protein